MQQKLQQADEIFYRMMGMQLKLHDIAKTWSKLNEDSC